MNETGAMLRQYREWAEKNDVRLTPEQAWADFALMTGIVRTRVVTREELATMFPKADGTKRTQG